MPLAFKTSIQAKTPKQPKASKTVGGVRGTLILSKSPRTKRTADRFVKQSRLGRPKRASQDGEVSLGASPERLVFARNLRRSRRWLEISQEQMALQAGMSRSYVSGVELGERNISVDNMARLAAVLQLPLRQLLDPDYILDDHLN